MPQQGLSYTNQLYFAVIEQDNPVFMLLMDLSLYTDKFPSTPVYDIVPPGYTSAVRISAIPKGITSINSSLLFSTFTSELPALTEIPDGIYGITYRVQPYDTFWITRQELRTTQLERTLDMAYIGIERYCRHAYYNQWKMDLLNVEIMVRTAKAFVRLNNVVQGAAVYKEAQVEIARIGRTDNMFTV